MMEVSEGLIRNKNKTVISIWLIALIVAILVMFLFYIMLISQILTFNKFS